MSENSLRSVLAEFLHSRIVAAENSPLNDDEKFCEDCLIDANNWLQENGLLTPALAATQEPQPRDSRTFEEVIQLHIDSSESMLGVFQRTGDKDGAAMQGGVTAGLKRAIEVYGNWSKKGAAGAPAASGREELLIELRAIAESECARYEIDGINTWRMVERILARVEAAAPRPEMAPAVLSDKAISEMRKLRDYLKSRAWEDGLCKDPDLDDAAECLDDWALSLTMREAPPDLAGACPYCKRTDRHEEGCDFAALPMRDSVDEAFLKIWLLVAEFSQGYALLPLQEDLSVLTSKTSELTKRTAHGIRKELAALAQLKVQR